MARLTVEDCIERVPNRFELVLLSAQRARELGSGTEPTVDRDNDKNPVIALREIAEDTVELDAVRRTLVHGGELQQEEEGLYASEVGLSGDAIAIAEAGLASTDDEHNEAAFSETPDGGGTAR